MLCQASRIVLCEQTYVLPLAAEKDLGRQVVFLANNNAASAAGSGLEK
jgi:hypothetical protein